MGFKEFWRNRKKWKESQAEMSAPDAEKAPQSTEGDSKPASAKSAAEQEEVCFDREYHKPVIRSSICTGEQVAGFKDRRTGKFTEIMLVRDNEDLEEFTRKFGISREEITREW